MLVEDFGGFRLSGEDAGEGGEVVDGFHCGSFCVGQAFCLMYLIYHKRRATLLRHAVGELLEEDLAAEFGIESLSVFLAGMPQPVFPHHDDGRAGHVDQLGEVGLCVPVPVSPIFESLLAGRLCTDKAVADWGMPAVAFYCVEESRIRVLGHCDAFAFDGGGETTHDVSFCFVLRFGRCFECSRILFW